MGQIQIFLAVFMLIVYNVYSKSIKNETTSGYEERFSQLESTVQEIKSRIQTMNETIAQGKVHY